MAKVTLTLKSNAMKSYLPLFSFAVLLASCSSVYKSGQTPDDVYFSPERPQEEYVQVNKRDNRMYRDDDVALEDQYLRMKVRNRRYAFLDNDVDCYCYGSNYNSYNNYYRLNYGVYGNGWSSWNSGYGKFAYNPYSYNPYYYNPYYSNPYYSGVVYGNTNPVFNKPRAGNLNIYNGYNTNSSRGNNKSSYNTYSEDGNYRSTNSNAGGFLRNVFGSGNNNNSNGSTSTTQPSSNNSNSSSSSSNSHAPVRKF